MTSPILTGASISFHTNDDDKDHDTHVDVSVQAGTPEGGNAILAAVINDDFGHFPDHSDAGPFDLVVVEQLTRDQLKTGNVTINIEPNGADT